MCYLYINYACAVIVLELLILYLEWWSNIFCWLYFAFHCACTYIFNHLTNMSFKGMECGQLLHISHTLLYVIHFFINNCDLLCGYGNSLAFSALSVLRNLHNTPSYPIQLCSSFSHLSDQSGHKFELYNFIFNNIQQK